MAETVYVATIDTSYEVMAVAKTAKVAEWEAARMAYRFLRDAGALTPETDTLQKIIDYFGVTLTKVEIGKAAFVGNSDGS